MVKIKDIEEIYKRHSNQKLETPPPAVWDRIEASLNAAQPKRRAIWLWRTAGAAAVFIGLISLGLFFFNQPEQEEAAPISAHTASSVSENQEAPLLAEDNRSEPSEPDIYSGEDNTTVKTEGRGKSSFENRTLLVEANTAQVTAVKQDNEGKEPEIKTAAASKSESEPRSEPVAQHLAHAPDKPLFATQKVEIKKLFENQAKEDWKENYNVSSSYFDQQEALSAASHKRKLQIGAAVSPIYSFRQTSGGSEVPTAASMAGSYSEKGLTSTGGGIHVNVEMGKNWGIESGLRYARLGQEVNTDIQSSRVYAMNTEKESYGTTSLKTISLNNSLGDIKQPQSSVPQQYDERAFASSDNTLLVDIRNDEKVTIGQLNQHIDYIEIPLTFRYYVINSSTKLSLAAGFSTNWLVANNAYLSESGKRQKIGETNGLSSMNFSTHAGFAFSIPVYGPLSFRIEPRINYFINEINRQHPVKFKPYSVGIYSGIQYTIGE